MFGILKSTLAPCCVTFPILKFALLIGYLIQLHVHAWKRFLLPCLLLGFINNSVKAEVLPYLYSQLV